MGNIDRNNMRQVLNLKTKLSSNKGRFVITDEVLNHYEKYYKYVTFDLRLLHLAAGDIGNYSDCYILYAIAKLGICDITSIRLFLQALKKAEPNLHILGTRSMEVQTDNLRGRINFLLKNGFLFRWTYLVQTISENTGSLCDDEVYLYSIDRDSQSFMNQKLGKKVNVNLWIQAKPIEEVVGWAATSYVGTMLMQEMAYEKTKEGVFRTPKGGTWIAPIELKFKSAIGETYVLGVPSFLYKNSARQSEEDYLESCVHKLVMIEQYLYYRGQKDKQAAIVVVVQNMEDLEELCGHIKATEILLPHLDKIYFSCEAFVRGEGHARNMLQISIKDNQHSYLATTPKFLIV